MADYIERVKVIGTVDMNTEEAERKLGQLKEPITVRLDIEDKGLFQSIQQDINKIERAVSKIDFSGIGKNLSDEVKKGTEQAVKDIQKFEKKILFVDSEYNRLSEVTDSFISLLYPFQWIHTYIPIMSDQMIKYLEAFLPFINGINEILMPFVRDTLIENEDEVYIIYIAKNQIDINLSLTGKKVKLAKKM